MTGAEYLVTDLHLPIDLDNMYCQFRMNWLFVLSGLF